MSDPLEDFEKRILVLVITRDDKCGLCAQTKSCKHYDKDLGALICIDCISFVAGAQQALDVAGLPAGGKGML